MPRTFRSLFVIAIVATSVAIPRTARAQEDAQSGMIVIKGATIFTATDRGTVEGGSIVLRKGKISRVSGPSRRPAPVMPGVETIDATGKFVTPGLIDAWTLMGLDAGGPVDASASLRAIDAIDVFQTSHFADAWRGGVTGVCIEPPGIGGVVGTASVVRIRSASSVVEEASEPTALVARIGLGVKGPIARLGEIKGVRDAFEQAAAYREAWEEYDEKLEEYKKKLKDGETVKLKKEDEKEADKKEEKKPEQPTRRPRGRRGPRPRPSDFASMTDAELLAWLSDSHVPGEDVLEDEAHGHADLDAEGEEKKDEKKPAKKDGKDDKDKKDGELTTPERPAFDANNDVMVRALKREIPVRFEAHRPGDIAIALKIIDAYHLDAIIVGATGAYVAAEPVVDVELPVVFGQLTGSGGVDRSHSADFSAEAPAALASKGGKPIVIASGRQGANSGSQYLTQNAAIAVSGGLDENAALRAITIEAAKVCGIAETVGSLEKGKRADVVIWSGHPLAAGSYVERVFMDGVEVYKRADD